MLSKSQLLRSNWSSIDRRCNCRIKSNSGWLRIFRRREHLSCTTSKVLARASRESLFYKLSATSRSIAIRVGHACTTRASCETMRVSLSIVTARKRCNPSVFYGTTQTYPAPVIRCTPYTISVTQSATLAPTVGGRISIRREDLTILSPIVPLASSYPDVLSKRTILRKVMTHRVVFSMHPPGMVTVRRNQWPRPGATSATQISNLVRCKTSKTMASSIQTIILRKFRCLTLRVWALMNLSISSLTIYQRLRPW